MRSRLRHVPILILWILFGGQVAAVAGDRSGVRIQVRPAVVYAGSTVKLGAGAGESRERGKRYFWRCERGVLLFDDLAEVQWKAPAEPGRTRLDVTVAGAEGTWSATTIVEVESPDTRGMCWIPPGPFTQGDVVGQRNQTEVKTFQNTSDEPFRTVFLDGYWIDRFPVTHARYRDFLEEAMKQGLLRIEPIGVWGEFDGSWVPYYYFQSYEKLVRGYLKTVNARRPKFLHWISWDADESSFRVEPGKETTPVVDVSWFGAAAFARFYGKQLPSEAQWEKAARGTDRRKYPWGDNAPTAYHANINYARGYAPIPVGSYRPYSDSPYGVCDMVAGQFEWTGDWFNASYYRDNWSDVPQRNPTGTFWGQAHTIRSLPYALFHPGNTLEDDEAVSFRYHWHFEFFVGDIFANRETTFRTVVAASPDDLRYESDF